MRESLAYKDDTDGACDTDLDARFKEEHYDVFCEGSGAQELDAAFRCGSVRVALSQQAMYHAVEKITTDENEDGADSNDKVASNHLGCLKVAVKRLCFPEAEEVLVDVLCLEEVESAGLQDLNLDHFRVFGNLQVKEDT